jgi:hypothetical protein
LNDALTHFFVDGSLNGLSGSVPGGMRGVAVTAVLAGPGPIAFIAIIVTAYSWPFARLVSVHLPAGGGQGHQWAPASTLIWYWVIGLPPSDVGATKRAVNWPDAGPETILEMVGGPGTVGPTGVAGVTGGVDGVVVGVAVGTGEGVGLGAAWTGVATSRAELSRLRPAMVATGRRRRRDTRQG